MRFANPAALGLLALAVPIVLLHMLKPRRPAVEVPSTFLWRQVSRPVSAATPWQRLRPSTLLVLQLLAVLLLAVAAARPVRDAPIALAQHTVFVVDASASMRASDFDPDRLSRAKDEARALRRRLPEGGLASIVVASSQPHVALSASADQRAFDETLGVIRADAGGADFAGAFVLAESLETPGVPIGFVLLSDGNLTPAERRLIPPGTRYVPIGIASDNQAITRVGVEPRGSGLHATIGIRNTGPREATRTLRVDVDGRTRATTRVVLPSGGILERGFDLPAGERVEALLEGNDLLAVDDRGFAVADSRPALRVLHAGPPNLFWDGLLGSIPGLEVERTETSRAAHGFDAAVYAGVPVPADPGAPYLAVATPGGGPGVRVTGEVEGPVPTLVRGADPLLVGLDLSEVRVARAQRIDAPGDEVLVGAEGAPLLVRGTRSGRPAFYLAFAVEDSNLGVQVAFPVLGDRLLGELTRTATLPDDVTVGAQLPLEGHGAVAVTGPGGFRRDVPAGAPAPVAERPGFWTITDERGVERTLAVNPDPTQSDIEPVSRLPVRPRATRPGETPPAGDEPLLGWVVAALAAVLLPELWLSRRRSGVSRAQWRAALACRLAIALLLIGAVAGLALPRPGTGTAVVFAVDASDSMGAGGRAEALQWVQQALQDQPRGSRAGVVLFGGDARVERAVQERLELTQPGARVDTARTNLDAGLRLAGAILPSDARRRVVVVSDGRATEGDPRSEARRLADAGVRIDVHPVHRAAGPDAAVVSLDAPSLVREGETYELRAGLTTTVSQSVRLTLRRDGAVVGERTVDLDAGDTEVAFEDVASEPGIHRYGLEVHAERDTVPENNVGFAAVRVEGPARVLVVEGMPSDGETLAASLRAGGLVVDVVPPAGLPHVDELAAYEATVLVDVEARALSTDQVRVLHAATRDLGRGLVAVGGDRSFSVGGYLDTELERLLPVRSDVDDPKRRPSVAQVLAIDTSGSMGACHCDPRRPTGFGGDRGDGGINKTDISRAAAARTVRALRQNDLVGVLAFNTQHHWILPLGPIPAEEAIDEGLSRLSPRGGTAITEPLQQAAQRLLETNRQLRHIILFTDGWTNESGLVDEARRIAEQGITISVLATGEGPGEELRQIAEAGRGRFYPGTDLNEIPRIMMEEATVAARQFVNEGEFFPTVRADTPVTRDLTASPPLLGYVATTAKPTAASVLEVGDEADPLLATWRVGLGRATAWTSDASRRWSQHWATWDGYSAFWSAVVKETFPLGGTGTGVQAEIVGDLLRITVDREEGWPDGAVATARLTTPDLRGVTLPLERSSSTAFSGEVHAPASGVYATGVEVSAGGQTVATGTGLAARSYSEEYRLASTDTDTLVALSALTGGRGTIEPGQAFDPEGLEAGRRSMPLAGLLLLLAALLWPVDVALRRLALREAAPPAAAAAARVARDVRVRLHRRRAPVEVEPMREPEPVVAPPETVRRLLDRKRGRRSVDDQ